LDLSINSIINIEINPKEKVKKLSKDKNENEIKIFDIKDDKNFIDYNSNKLGIKNNLQTVKIESKSNKNFPDNISQLKNQIFSSLQSENYNMKENSIFVNQIINNINLSIIPKTNRSCQNYSNVTNEILLSENKNSHLVNYSKSQANKILSNIEQSSEFKFLNFNENYHTEYLKKNNNEGLYKNFSNINIIDNNNNIDEFSNSNNKSQFIEFNMINNTLESYDDIKNLNISSETGKFPNSNLKANFSTKNLIKFREDIKFFDELEEGDISNNNLHINQNQGFSNLKKKTDNQIKICIGNIEKIENEIPNFYIKHQEKYLNNNIQNVDELNINNDCNLQNKKEISKIHSIHFNQSDDINFPNIKNILNMSEHFLNENNEKFNQMNNDKSKLNCDILEIENNRDFNSKIVFDNQINITYENEVIKPISSRNENSQINIKDNILIQENKEDDQEEQVFIKINSRNKYVYDEIENKNNFFSNSILKNEDENNIFQGEEILNNKRIIDGDEFNELDGVVTYKNNSLNVIFEEESNELDTINISHSENKFKKSKNQANEIKENIFYHKYTTSFNEKDKNMDLDHDEEEYDKDISAVLKINENKNSHESNYNSTDLNSKYFNINVNNSNININKNTNENEFHETVGKMNQSTKKEFSNFIYLNKKKPTLSLLSEKSKIIPKNLTENQHYNKRNFNSDLSNVQSNSKEMTNMSSNKEENNTTLEDLNSKLIQKQFNQQLLNLNSNFKYNSSIEKSPEKLLTPYNPTYIIKEFQKNLGQPEEIYFEEKDFWENPHINDQINKSTIINKSENDYSSNIVQKTIKLQGIINDKFNKKFDASNMNINRGTDVYNNSDIENQNLEIQNIKFFNEVIKENSLQDAEIIKHKINKYKRNSNKESNPELKFVNLFSNNDLNTYKNDFNIKDFSESQILHKSLRNFKYQIEKFLFRKIIKKIIEFNEYKLICQTEIRKKEGDSLEPNNHSKFDSFSVKNNNFLKDLHNKNKESILKNENYNKKNQITDRNKEFNIKTSKNLNINEEFESSPVSIRNYQDTIEIETSLIKQIFEPNITNNTTKLKKSSIFKNFIDKSEFSLVNQDNFLISKLNEVAFEKENNYFGYEEKNNNNLNNNSNFNVNSYSNTNSISIIEFFSNNQSKFSNNNSEIFIQEENKKYYSLESLSAADSSVFVIEKQVYLQLNSIRIKKTNNYNSINNDEIIKEKLNFNNYEKFELDNITEYIDLENMSSLSKSRTSKGHPALYSFINDNEIIDSKNINDTKTNQDITLGKAEILTENSKNLKLNDSILENHNKIVPLENIENIIKNDSLYENLKNPINNFNSHLFNNNINNLSKYNKDSNTENYEIFKEQTKKKKENINTIGHNTHYNIENLQNFISNKIPTKACIESMLSEKIEDLRDCGNFLNI